MDRNWKLMKLTKIQFLQSIVNRILKQDSFIYLVRRGAGEGEVKCEKISFSKIPQFHFVYPFSLPPFSLGDLGQV